MEPMSVEKIKQEVLSDEDASSSSSDDELSSIDELSSCELSSDEDSPAGNDPSRVPRNREKGKSFQRIYEVDPKLEKMLRDMKLLRCLQCQRKFTSFNGLSKHSQGVHKKACPFITCCQVQFWGRTEAYDHLHYHLNHDAFKCLECGKLCMCYRQLERHKKCSHGPVGPAFICKICDKAFKSDDQLVSHCKSHIDPRNRPFKCPECDKRFNQPCLVKAHAKSAHVVHKPVKCDICGAMVAHLKSHMDRQHTPPDQLKACSVCGKKMSSVALTEHVRRSHKRRNFPCETCERVFQTQTGLSVHMKRDHLGVLVNCRYCPHQARSRTDLYYHHQTKHPVEFGKPKKPRGRAKGVKVKVEKDPC